MLTISGKILALISFFSNDGS